MTIQASTLRLPLLLAALLLWEIGTRLDMINPHWFTPPTVIATRLAAGLADGALLTHAGVTLFETLVGFAVGMVAGVLFGLLLAFLHRTREILMPYLLAIYGIPRPAMAPLFVIWFGIGMVSKVMLIVSLVYFVALIYVLDGVRHIDPLLLRFASTTGASRRQVLMKITFPSLLSWISASMKLGMSLAIIGAVVGEVVAAENGLGYYILQASYQMDTAGVYVGLMALAAMGWALVYAMERLDRRLFHWQRDIVV